MLELKVGKSYRTREGKKILITTKADDRVYITNDGRGYSPDGISLWRSDWDIISEWEEEVELDCSDFEQACNLLERWASIAKTGIFRDKSHFSIGGTEVWSQTMSFLSAIDKKKQPKAEGAVVDLTKTWVVWHIDPDGSLYCCDKHYSSHWLAKHYAGESAFAIVPYGTTKFRKGEGLEG